MVIIKVDFGCCFYFSFVFFFSSREKKGEEMEGGMPGFCSTAKWNIVTEVVFLAG